MLQNSAKGNIQNEDEPIIIVGAGVAGLFAGIALSRIYKNILILEKGSRHQYYKRIQERNKHPHVCVAKSLDEFKEVIPNLFNILNRKEFNIFDPGENFFFNSSSGPLPMFGINKLCGSGSYLSFIQALHEIVEKNKRITLQYNSNIVLINKNEKILICEEHKKYSYSKLVLSYGHRGIIPNLLKKSKIEINSNISYGKCNYHSFDIKLKASMGNIKSFILEASPEKRKVGILFVLKDQYSGILSFGNFGPYFQIKSLEELKVKLKDFKNDLPSNFLNNIEEISSQSNYLSDSFPLNTLSEKNGLDIFLIGDAILRVPAYTGLGLAVASKSVVTLFNYLNNSELTNNNLTYDDIFKDSASEIFSRLSRYDKQWSKNNNRISRLKVMNCKRKIMRYMGKYIFFLSITKKSKIATRYIQKNFHMVENRSLRYFYLILLRASFETYFGNLGVRNAKVP